MKDNNAYKTGLYMRLSREDDDTQNESESITNQRVFLLEYVKQNRFNYVDEYIDDGYTGTNFDRPSFKRLLKDIENGKINCIITKDMSRLGRDYIEVGNYIEKFFPEHNIRYIAINDNLDTLKENVNISTQFKSLVNDYYARDISEKVKSNIIAKKKSGKFLGGIPPYGYKFASEDNHHNLIIDEETSFVVKKMFNMYANGKSLYQIADTFNKNNIPIPSIKKKLNRGVKSTAYGNWQTRTIDEILKNPTYIGNLTQGRRKKVNYKSKKIVRVPKDNWIIVENTHEPIVDRDTFEKVQNIYEKNKNRPRGSNNILLSGFIYCKECGHKIGISQGSNKKFYCNCNYYKKYSKLNLCTPHSMPYAELKDNIIKEIRKECRKSVKGNNLEDVLKKNSKKEKAIIKLQQLIVRKKQEISINSNALENLYISKLKQEVNPEIYKNIYNKLNDEFSTLNNDLKVLNEDYESINANVKTSSEENYKKAVEEYLSLKNPTRELLSNLIDKIIVDEHKNIEIHYKIREYI